MATAPRRTWSWLATTTAETFGIEAVRCNSILSVFNVDCLLMKKLRSGVRRIDNYGDDGNYGGNKKDRRGLGHDDIHCPLWCCPSTVDDPVDKSFGMCKFTWNVVTAILIVVAFFEVLRQLIDNSGGDRAYSLSSQLHHTEDCHSLPPLAIHIGGQSLKDKDNHTFYVHIQVSTAYIHVFFSCLHTD